MKELIKKTFIFVLTLFLLTGTVFAFPQDIGTHAKSAVIDSNIQVRQGGFLEYVGNDFSPFAIAAQNSAGQYVGSFYTGETVNFRVDVTSWNAVCQKTYVIAEVYNAQDNFIKSSSAFIGAINGGNNYFIANIPYTISSTETSLGTWNAAGYLWCDDSTGDNAQKLISTSYSTSFSVNKAGSSCTEGYSGVDTCRSGDTTSSGNGEDVYKLYINKDCTSSYKRTDTCSSSQICSAGDCIGVSTPSSCGDGLCLNDEDNLNCPLDCSTTNPPSLPPALPPASTDILSYTWIIWIIIIGLIVLLFFTPLGRKGLGAIGIKLK